MNKKIVAAALTCGTAIIALSGCAAVKTSDTMKNSDGKVYNNQYNETNMVTTSGKDIDLSDDGVVLNTEAGIGYVTPEEWGNLADQNSVMVQSAGAIGTELLYIPSEDIEKLNSINDDMSAEEQEEVFEDAYSNVQLIALLFRVNPNDEDTSFDESQLASYGLTVDSIFSKDDNTYKIAYMTEVPEDGFTDLDIKDMTILTNSMTTLEDNMILFPPVDPAENFKVDMTSFTTTDLDGNEVTADIFKDYDVTMVNVWTTWCQYCVEEMPYIEKLYEGRDKNVNVIGICMDGADETETAKQEVEQTGVTYPILIGNDEITEKLQDNLSGYPTTFFVNSKGEIIGTIQVGAPGQDEQTVIDAYNNLIQEALK